ncbi:hypothetical protein [Microcoleus sp. EPA2]|uniref:hypothetical protein n=1 Tax=Microcoleus sp. EPA2 TaxID=2841654 RepID=UPI00312B68C4
MNKGVDCKIFTAPKIDKDDRAPGLGEDDRLLVIDPKERSSVTVNGAHLSAATSLASPQPCQKASSP